MLLSVASCAVRARLRNCCFSKRSPFWVGRRSGRRGEFVVSLAPIVCYDVLFCFIALDRLIALGRRFRAVSY